VRTLCATLVLLALALAGGAGRAGAVSPKTPLASLVLPRSELGRAADGLQIKLVSGETSNARAAGDSFDPADTAASVAKAGRISGFRLVYGDTGFEALRQGRGLIDLGTSVDYFKTVKQVRAYETTLLRDLKRARGKNLQGLVVERVTTFRVQGLGPAAVGVRLVQRIGSRRIYSTYVDFQLGPLLCEAAVRRADAADAGAETVAIAQLLADRILRYSSGKLKAAPVTLPRPLGMTRPGKTAPDLPTMVLGTNDFKAAAVVVGQGYLPDDDAITSYYRQFQFDPRSGLVLARNSVALERDRREASGRMVVLRLAFTGPEAAETLVGLVTSAATSPKLDGVRSSLGAGEESFSVTASFTMESRRLRVALVHVRRQRVVGTLIVVAEPKALPSGKVGGYARSLDRSIKQAFAKPKLTA
jgi:hypothetical protein